MYDAVWKRLLMPNPKDLTREPSMVSKGKSAEAEQGLASILELAEAAIREVPEQEWDRLPADMATNVDHRLYGARKRSRG